MSTREYYKNCHRGGLKRSGQISRSTTVSSNELDLFQDATSFRRSPPETPGSGQPPPTPSTSLNPLPQKRKKPSTSMHIDDHTNDILNLRDSGTSYYSLPSSHQSFSDLHRFHLSPEPIEQHESAVPASSSRRDRDKGKTVERAHTPHSGSSRRDRDTSTDDTRRSKHQERADKHVYSGPLAHAEFERMKKEIDTLKKAAQDHKKATKKQTKKIEELKIQLSSETQARQSHEAQVQTLKAKYDKHEELVITIETSLQCQICMDLLHKPFALSPCGHILCLSCLQQWFRQAPPSVDDMDMDLDLASDPHYVLTRSKSCPCCRAVVRRRPVPVFLVKAVVGSIAKARLGSGNANNTRSPGGSSRGSGASSLDEEDPWKGIFLSDEDEEDYESSDEYDEDDEDEEEDSDDSDEDHVMWALNVEMGGMPGPFRLESEESSDGGSDSGEEDEDEDGGESDSAEGEGEGEGGAIYVPARWEPPTVSIDIEDLDYDLSEFPNLDDSSSLHNMLRRGCSLSMIQNFEMTYSHRRGLIALIPSLDERYVPSLNLPGGAAPIREDARNRVFLGWNIRVDEADEDGQVYMKGVLREVKRYLNRKWRREGRTGYLDAFDVKRLVRVGDVEEWDTTDTEAWVGGRDGSVSEEGEGD